MNRFVFAVLLLVVSSFCRAEDGKGFIVIVEEENDKYVVPTTDKHYTQGLHLTFLWPDNDVPFGFQPLSRLTTLGMTNAIAKFGFQVGQNIYTPQNTVTPNLIRDDRPYAGWLWVGLIRETRGLTAGSIPTIDHIQLDLGVVGPNSLADDTQVWFHGVIQIARPRGWRHQLNNEPGVALRLNRRWLLWDSSADTGLQAQLIPSFGANLGNIDTSANLGAMMRVGRNIPDEFGATIEPAWGWYVFTKMAGHAVLRNEFLDGNLFSRSHSVSKEPAFLDVSLGVAVELQRLELSYTYNYHTPEFRLQQDYDAFGSIGVTYRF